jgi:hypothetical protein
MEIPGKLTWTEKDGKKILKVSGYKSPEDIIGELSSPSSNVEVNPKLREQLRDAEQLIAELLVIGGYVSRASTKAVDLKTLPMLHHPGREMEIFSEYFKSQLEMPKTVTLNDPAIHMQSGNQITAFIMPNIVSFTYMNKRGKPGFDADLLLQEYLKEYEDNERNANIRANLKGSSKYYGPNYESLQRKLSRWLDDQFLLEKTEGIIASASFIRSAFGKAALTNGLGLR